MSAQENITAKELDNIEAALKKWIKPNLYWRYAELENQFNSCKHRIGEDGPEYDEYYKEMASEAKGEMRKLESAFENLHKGLAAIVAQAKRAA